MTKPDDPSPASRANDAPLRHSAWLGWAILALAFVAAAALSWRKWPDILIDFGLQLYMPWRILHGAELYRDLFYFAGGPFSQYFNALLFKIFGVSFSTLIAANLIWTAAMLAVIYRSFLVAADFWTATLIGLGVLAVFAFAEYSTIGNYNYVAPYSHETLHGLALSIFAIALSSKWIKTGKIWTALGAGFCAGLVFLTKPDIFTALALAVMAASVLFCLKHGRKKFVTSLAAFLVAGIVPSLFFFLYFLREEGWRESLRSLVFGWLPLFQGTVTKNPFYRWCTGLDHPLENVTKIFIYFFAVLLVVAFYAAGLRWAKGLKYPASRLITWAVLLSPLLVWAVMRAALPMASADVQAALNWIQSGWPLPLLGLSACLLIAWNYRALEGPVFPLLWSVFGLALLAKLGLFPRIWHYGFVLAMPAFAASVYLLFRLLPMLLEKKFAVPAWPLRVTVGLVLLIGFGTLFNQSETVYAEKGLPLGNGGDTVITYNATSDASKAIYAALLWTDKYMPPGATLAVLPEGVMLNYLTRHVNSTPCLDWNPTMFTVFGQNAMTDAVEDHPPDYIFIVEWNGADFGVGYFGSSADYGLGLMQWIQKNYRTELVIGHEPLTNGQFGIKIMKRLPAIPASGKLQ